MATYHLNRDSAASARHLNALATDGNAHLAIVKRSSAWNAKEFVFAPVTRKYANVVAYNTRSTASAASFYADFNSLCASVNSKWAAMGASAWVRDTAGTYNDVGMASAEYLKQCGDRAIFAYWADCVGIYPGVADTAREIGCSRVFAKFNLTKSMAFGTTTSVTPYLRVWCGSSLVQNADLIGSDRAQALAAAFSGAGSLRFRIGDSTLAPADLASGYYSVSLMGGAGNQGIHDTTSTSYKNYLALKYDVWNNPTYKPIYVWMHNAAANISDTTYNADRWYYDFELTGNALTAYNAQVTADPSDVAFVFGMAIVNAMAGSGSQYRAAHSVLTDFVEKVELVLKVTGATIT